MLGISSGKGKVIGISSNGAKVVRCASKFARTPTWQSQYVVVDVKSNKKFNKTGSDNWAFNDKYLENYN